MTTAAPPEATAAGPAAPPDRLKRAFDLVVAAGLLAALAPVFAAIAVLIKLDTRGPVFFRQTRVGRGGRHFRMWKFRKMPNDMRVQGPALTGRYDPRLTRVGRVLERTKLDELPQLLNVLAGDMSLVGPRPEVPKFVDPCPEAWAEVLSVRPGVVGPAQLIFRNESELYPPGCPDVEGFYLAHILPPKLAVDARYTRERTLAGDALLLVRTAWAAVGGVVTRRTLVERRFQIVNTVALSAMGVAITAICGGLVGGQVTPEAFLWLVAVSAAVKPVCIVGYRIPKSLATSVTATDLIRCVWCATVSGSVVVCAMVLGGFRDVSRAVLVADTGGFMVGLIFYKLVCYQLYLTFVLQRVRALSRHLVGWSLLTAPAGMAAVLLARHGLAGADGRAFAVLVGAAALVRPAVFLFRPVERPGGPAGVGWWAWWRLGTGTLAGSGLILTAALLTNEREVLLVDLGLDAAVQLVLAGAVVAAHRRPADHPRPADRERVLVVGSGLRLSGYLTALSALPEHQFHVVGTLSPRAGERASTVRGVPVIGEVADAPQLVSLHNITRIVVLDDSVCTEGFERLQQSFPADPGRVVRIDLLSPLVQAGDQ